MSVQGQPRGLEYKIAAVGRLDFFFYDASAENYFRSLLFYSFPLGDLLSPEQLNTALPIFLDRLRNEITRLTTVKSLSLIAHSPLHIQLDQILGTNDGHVH